MEKLIIDRSKWRTGGSENLNNPVQTGSGPTQLLNGYGFMCCLGFECLRLGKTPEQIVGESSPTCLKWDESNHLVIEEAVLNGETKFTSRAIQINDYDTISLHIREEQIKEHFATVGIEVTFINDYQ